MKKVLVSVKSIQRDTDGQDQVVELVSPGTYGERNGVYYIRYDESSVTGLEGVKTTIKVYSNSIVLVRTGAVTMRHEYILGQERDIIYQTPFGDLAMSVTTHELEVDAQKNRCSVHLGYDISLEGQAQFYNQLDIEVREE